MLATPVCPVPTASRPIGEQVGSLTAKQAVGIACAIARLSAVLCDLGQVPASGSELVDEPYIWDMKED